MQYETGEVSGHSHKFVPRGIMDCSLVMWLESLVPGTHGANVSSLAGLYTEYSLWFLQLRHCCRRTSADLDIEISSLDGFMKARYCCFYTGSIRCYVLNKLDASSNGIYAL